MNGKSKYQYLNPPQVPLIMNGAGYKYKPGFHKIEMSFFDYTPETEWNKDYDDKFKKYDRENIIETVGKVKLPWE